MQLLKYIPLQLTCCLILGVLTAYYLNMNVTIALGALVSLFVILMLLYFRSYRVIGQTVYFRGATFLVFFFIGATAMMMHNDLYKNNHYTTLLVEQHPNKAVLQIIATLKPTNYFIKYEATVVLVNDQKAQGSILVNLSKDNHVARLKVDDKIVVNTPFLPINKPKNPYQFNYQTYLQTQNIYRQIIISEDTYIRLKTGKTSFLGLTDKLRGTVNAKLANMGFKGDELAVLNALLMGQRQEISKELIDNYAKAGAIHLLAVSGLHVGIVMLLIRFLLQPLKRLKNGKILQTILIIFSLWIFAFIAGMSASVIRAVTMFTALSIGLAVGRKSSIYKNLIISLFFLLLLNPYYLFEVGFQLSYLAVFSIVWIQPMIYNSWKPKWKLVDYFWQLVTVSFAAQLGVLPLSLYYFHQFPGLFFVTNLLIIPVLGGILGLGIVVIMLSLLNMLPPMLALLYQETIHLMNTIISWIAKQESFLFQEIFFPFLVVISSYLFLIYCFQWVQRKTWLRLTYALISLILVQGVFIYEKYKSVTTNELVIFNKSRATVLARRIGRKLHVFKSDNFDENNPILKSYKIACNIDRMEVVDLAKNIYKIGNRKLLIVDSLGVYKVNALTVDYVLLRQSPNINLERLILKLKPKLILADASNYKSYVRTWNQTCFENSIPFHYTAIHGAFTENF